MSQAKNVEIERKFLVKGDSYKELAIKHYEIVQGYLCKGEGKTVRVRIRDNQAFLTIKGGRIEAKDESLEAKGEKLEAKGERAQGLARFEWEKEISVADAKELLQLALPGLIEKTRWIVPANHGEREEAKGERQEIIGERQEIIGEKEGAREGKRELVWEVDEFHGRLEGRTLAEIELDYESQAFEKPAFIGEEVTGRPEYYNANM